MGRTTIVGDGCSWLAVTRQNGRAVSSADGCRSKDGRVRGTYMHGLFDTPAVLAKWLSGLGLPEAEVAGEQGVVRRDKQYAALARHFEAHADVDGLMAEVGFAPERRTT